ncbi:MAG: type II secretion system inner membrane protein GspF [Planctomycetota bacterium]
MPIFEYKAFTETGATKTGILDADTARDARLKLRKESVHVVELRQVEQQEETSRFSLEALLTRRANIGEVAMITRQFATLLDAGVPMAEAMRVMIEQMADRKMEKVFRDVREKLTQGGTLGDALSHHPKIFGDLYVNMVRAGEASGHVDTVLFRVSEYLQKQSRMRNKIVSALMYPIIMVMVGIVVIIVLMTFVVPKITKLVKMRNSELPGITEVLITVSNFMKTYWPLLLAGIAALFLTLGAVRRNPAGRMAVDRLLLKIPIFGDLIRKAAISRFAVTLSTLLKSGVPVLDSLDIVKAIVGNAVIERVLGEVHDRIIEGTDISTPIKKSGVFPPTVGYMIAVGEQSGQLEEILDKLAEAYDEEVEIATQRMTAVLEPMLILVMAAVVTFIILAVLLPMLELSKLRR